MRAAHCGSTVSYTTSVQGTWWNPLWMFNNQVISWIIHVTCGMFELKAYCFAVKINLFFFFRPSILLQNKREEHETAQTAHVTEVTDRQTGNVNTASLSASYRTCQVWNAANGADMNRENNNDVWRIRTANERRWRRQSPKLINLISRPGVLHAETCFSLQDKAVVHSVLWGWKEFFFLFCFGGGGGLGYVSTICISMLGVDYDASLSHYKHLFRGQAVAFGQLKAAWDSQHRQVSIRNSRTLPQSRRTIFNRGLHTSQGSWEEVIKLHAFSGVSSPPLFDI